MHQRLRILADYLLKCGSAAEVNPRDIDAKSLPHFFILNVERGADGVLSGLRVRFTGTALDTAFQRKLLGNRLEDYVHGPRGGEVIAGFHDCAETGRALWMRQVVQLEARPPRFVEGITIRITPERIYGGLIVGEVANDDSSDFQSMDLH
jgi:hypothetical protein